MRLQQAPAPATTTGGSTNQPQMLVQTPGGLQPIQPAQVVNSLGQPLGQPQVLGNINMVQTAENVNINIMGQPPPQAAVTSANNPTPIQPATASAASAQHPQTISIINAQGQTVTLPRSVLMNMQGMKINLPSQPLQLNAMQVGGS